MFLRGASAMALAPGPSTPRRRHRNTSVASVHLRRVFAKSAADSLLPSSSNQKAGVDGRERCRAHLKEPQLLCFQPQYQEQLESKLTIASLQENLSALVSFNKREKALSASLKDEVARLTEELAKLKETHEANKKEEMISNAILEIKSECDSDKHFLPDISSGVLAAGSQSTLQQMESNQSKMLSLEGRCQHMTENNKKLLATIEQLKKTQTETNLQLDELRQRNVHLLIDAESMNSTISSQAEIICDLRSTVEKLSHDMKHVGNLHNTLVRCQRELDAVKEREKQLQEKHEQLQMSAREEYEVLMSKFLVTQQRLSKIDSTTDQDSVSEIEIKSLQQEKKVLQIDLEAMTSRCNDSQAQVDKLKKASKVLIQMKKLMKTEKNDVEALLALTRQKFEISLERQRKTEKLNASQKEFYNLFEARNEEVTTLIQKVMQLEDCIEERELRQREIVDDFHRVNAELQGLKQLSQDDTVQALQMARQKAGSYEALTLLNEEKKGLEDQVRLLQERLEAERVICHEEKEAKTQLREMLDTRDSVIEELKKENAALLEQMRYSPKIENPSQK
ncbi:uncharacterized protein PHALS_02251 [Plasmopara halstedii]|uniref:Uncharacterized protein n=1 Tax=Plasmopara halstedii TaxID=4781 RepID=A0A0P1AWR4_PLAHL|nr:uncharacterized protein PHALS_02251 [Plasmopara halstedii]CEG45918.1 hypothetical protein PHALS_02251 [Plasmopara halstedii]|eukprot:XP_024582287.1 hypothetical protein PHALS_02251 [Plasmopara halstedii]